MNIQEIRGLVLQVLKQGGWNQIVGIIVRVGSLKGRLEGRPDVHIKDGRSFLERGDATKILEVIWSLMMQGVLVPGTDDSNLDLAFLRLTDYGRRCLAEERLLPHDPDGFLVEFSKEVPSADPVILSYLEESLQCFLHGLNRAAAVMLGGASEKAVLVLLESYGLAVSNATKRKKYFTKLEKTPSIFRKFEAFEKEFAGKKANLPHELRESLDSLLRGVFDLIRNSRNEAGHPATGTVIDRDIVYTHLRLFVPYCKRIYGLVDWFGKNPV